MLKISLRCLVGEILPYDSTCLVQHMFVIYILARISVCVVFMLQSECKEAVSLGDTCWKLLKERSMLWHFLLLDHSAYNVGGDLVMKYSILLA